MFVITALGKLRYKDYSKSENSLSYPVSSRLDVNLFQNKTKQIINREAGDMAQQVKALAVQAREPEFKCPEKIKVWSCPCEPNTVGHGGVAGLLDPSSGPGTETLSQGNKVEGDIISTIFTLPNTNLLCSIHHIHKFSRTCTQSHFCSKIF